MQCFKCHRKMSQCKSEYGFYYFCSNCGRTFETGGQQSYNSKNYKSRFDYAKKEVIDLQKTDSAKSNEKNIDVKNDDFIFKIKKECDIIISRFIMNIGLDFKI